MNKAQKFTSFDELKSFEIKTGNYLLSLQKHNKLEKLITNIVSIKPHQANKTKLKQ